MDSTHGVSLVVAFNDMDNDGLQDFYIGNDGVEADLMHNRGGLKFDNIAAETGVATSDNGGAVSSMGADWGDYNRDGQLDLVVTNWQGDSFVLFQNLGDRAFADAHAGLPGVFQSAVALGDFDNDGRLDVILSGTDGVESEICKCCEQRMTARGGPPRSKTTKLCAEI